MLEEVLNKWKDVEMEMEKIEKRKTFDLYQEMLE